MAINFRELRDAPTEKLIALHDESAPSIQVGVNYYLEEIHRRDNDKLAQEMAAMTRQMLRLTLAMFAFAAISTAAVLITLFR